MMSSGRARSANDEIFRIARIPMAHWPCETMRRIAGSDNQPLGGYDAAECGRSAKRSVKANLGVPIAADYR